MSRISFPARLRVLASWPESCSRARVTRSLMSAALSSASVGSVLGPTSRSVSSTEGSVYGTD